MWFIGRSIIKPDLQIWWYNFSFAVLHFVIMSPLFLQCEETQCPRKVPVITFAPAHCKLQYPVRCFVVSGPLPSETSASARPLLRQMWFDWLSIETGVCLANKKSSHVPLMTTTMNPILSIYWRQSAIACLNRYTLVYQDPVHFKLVWKLSSPTPINIFRHLVELCIYPEYHNWRWCKNRLVPSPICPLIFC